MTLQEQFGQIDIYLFDQILRGNITPAMRVLDAGAGSGRNLIYLMRHGCKVFGVDVDAQAVEHLRGLALSYGDPSPAENFRVATVEQMPFADAVADAVICSAVLHFARSKEHFEAMLHELWRTLRPGGLLFCRLASRIGMAFELVREGIYRVGDAEWFLVDEPMLLHYTHQLGGEQADPLKTTLVQGHRAMTTWVLRKPIAR